MGAIVIINDEGWFVTARHIIQEYRIIQQAKAQFVPVKAKLDEIEKNPNLKPYQKEQQKRQLKISPKAITHYSLLIGAGGTGISQIFEIPEVDFAVCKMIGFDNTKVQGYPLFKDHTKSMEQGTSLCKMGYPFHSIKPTFQSGPAESFTLPTGSLPAPIFPLDGIYARTVNVPQSDPPYPFPLMYIETSTPGLRGQSGGPTIDVHGYLWAIQSQTRHYELGFGANQKNSKATDHLKNQYLHTGWGIHAQTITSFLTQNNISFQTSPN